MRLDIVTPEKKAFSDEIDSVVVPGEGGEMGILKSHAPLITTLRPGELRYLKNGEETSLAIGTGIVEISNDRVSVLTDMAMEEAHIDENAVEEALKSAQKALAETAPEDIEAVQILIQKSMAQLHIKRRRRRL
ncbi:MAG: ATP synthase F1 subunit epsilon [Verrucomicrobiales bacterium]|nr:ATP synthase F1 subunit epsilon [Verrucomicrobiales bacterium]